MEEAVTTEAKVTKLPQVHTTIAPGSSASASSSRAGTESLTLAFAASYGEVKMASDR
jgi:hypothetical protein